MTFDPLRSRNRAAALSLIALAVFVPALVLPRSDGDLTVRKLILFGSMSVMLISTVWFLVRWDESKRFIRLRAGQGILARWTIDAQRWEWFRGHSNEWDKADGVKPNDVDFVQALGGKPAIDIIVGADAILVGERFYPLEKTVRITTRADWMEFHDIIPKPRGTPLHLVLRLPLEPGKEQLAAAVSEGYARAAGQGVLVGRRALVLVALICFVGVPGVAALAFWIAKATGWVD
ncbi:MAG: hypothetical protein IT353_19445 [Gemmatimonadaceae bacterium]|nr:hypothetical protein [Gemmatimonadaceae bacterium]